MPPTLLKRLLAKEVRVDRSRLLQVFRFLVNNNFLRDFDPDAPKTDRAAARDESENAKPRKKGLDELWMFPWVDDPEQGEAAVKEKLKQLAAEPDATREEDEEDDEGNIVPK